LFLKQLAAQAGTIPALTQARLGSGLVHGRTVLRMSELEKDAPEPKGEAPVAGRLGSLVKIDSWDGAVWPVSCAGEQSGKELERASYRSAPFEIGPLVFENLARLERMGNCREETDAAAAERTKYCWHRRFQAPDPRP
jgi:hypothetical protein